MLPIFYFQISNRCLLYTFLNEFGHQVVGVVNGVNDTVVVSIVGFVEGAALKPKSLVGFAGWCLPYDVVDNPIGIGVFRSDGG